MLALPDVVIYREWLVLQKVDSEQQFSNNCTSEVPIRGTTPYSLSKAGRSTGRPKNVRLSEDVILLSTHAYRRAQSGVAIPVVHNTPTVQEASATIGAAPSVQTCRVCGYRYPWVAYAHEARKPVCSRDNRSFHEADTVNFRGKDYRTEYATVALGNLVFLYGVPDSIFTDNGMQLISNFFVGLWASLGTKLVTTTKYHPQTNVQVEQ